MDNSIKYTERFKAFTQYLCRSNGRTHTTKIVGTGLDMELPIGYNTFIIKNLDEIRDWSVIEDTWITTEVGTTYLVICSTTKIPDEFRGIIKTRKRGRYWRL